MLISSPFAALLALLPQDDARAHPVPPADAEFAGGISVTGPLEVIAVNTPGHPANVVPTLDVPYAPGGASASAFGRPYLSSNGVNWLIEARADTGTSADDVYLFNGQLFLAEGQPAPWSDDPLELIGPLDERVAVNNSGNVLITNNTTGGSSDDEYVVFFQSPETPQVLAREGQAIDPAIGLPAGAAWDFVLDTPVLTNAAVAGWRASSVDGVGSSDELFVFGSQVLIQTEVSTPIGQAGGAAEAVETIDSNDVFVQANGLSWIAQGDLTGSAFSDDVVVLDDRVVVQEQSPVPASPFIEPVDLNGVGRAGLDSGGNWFARGNNVDEQDWVIRNALVVAFSNGGNEVVPGEVETWSDAEFGPCFFAMAGNAAGDYVIGGTTDADPARNGVLVYDNGRGYRSVLCREGDPVDLDGNGAFDDDRFINSFGTDDVVLEDDGTVWFVATLKTADGESVDQGLFRLGGCDGYLRYGLNASPFNTLDLVGLGNTSIGATARVEVLGLEDPAVALVALSTGQGLFPFFDGVGLIDPFSVIGELFVVDGVNGEANLSLPIPENSSLVGIQLFLQAGSAGLSAPSGVVLSNGLRLTICP